MAREEEVQTFLSNDGENNHKHIDMKDKVSQVLLQLITVISSLVGFEPQTNKQKKAANGCWCE